MEISSHETAHVDVAPGIHMRRGYRDGSNMEGEDKNQGGEENYDDDDGDDDDDDG